MVNDSPIEFDENEEAIITELLNSFGDKKPKELELIATALYVAKNINQKSIQNIIDGVIKIKGTKYGKTQILDSIKQIEDFKYLRNYIQ